MGQFDESILKKLSIKAPLCNNATLAVPRIHAVEYIGLFIGPFPASFSLFSSPQLRLGINNWQMTGFDPETSGVGSNCSTILARLKTFV